MKYTTWDKDDASMFYVYMKYITQYKEDANMFYMKYKTKMKCIQNHERFNSFMLLLV